MKTLRLLVPLLAILGSGCLKLDETFTIRADGSATLELVYAISEPAVNQMKAILKVRDQMAALSGEESISPDDRMELFLNPAEDSLRREIRKHEKLGVTVERLKVESRDNWRHVQLKVACKSLADLAKTDIFAQYGFSLSRDSDGNYTLFRDRESRNADSAAGMVDPATLKLMTPVLEGFNAIFRVNTPGKILQANAHTKSIRSVSWEFSFDKDPNAITALQDQQFKIVFDGKGADGKAFSLSPFNQKTSVPPKAK